MDLYVFNLDFNRLGIIDDFIDLEIKSSYDSLSGLRMTVDGTSEYADLLQTGRILVKCEDVSKGYIIETREYLGEQSSELSIMATSLNVLLNDRIVLGQQEFTGNIEDVMKSFVLVNAVSPVNPNRIIPNLTIANNRGIDITTTEGAVNKPLCDYLYELAKKHNVSFDILMDHDNKKFVFDVWEGLDRSTKQSINPHVIFAKEFDNVLKQHYTESVADIRSTAIVLGEETEGSPREIVAVNDILSGFARKEIVVDANDIKKTYKDDYDREVTLTDAEYRRLLQEKGRNTLAEYQPIRTFESDVDGNSNFVYGSDYFAGDKVSVRNDELGIILHTRIMSVTEKENKQGETLQLNFGSNIPSFIEKVKRAVK